MFVTKIKGYGLSCPKVEGEGLGAQASQPLPRGLKSVFSTSTILFLIIRHIAQAAKSMKEGKWDRKKVWTI